MSSRRPSLPSSQSSSNPPAIDFSLFKKNQAHPQRSNDKDSFHYVRTRSASNGSQQSGSVNNVNPFSEPTRNLGGKGFSNQFSLHPDPNLWGYDVSPSSRDEDDWLHKPDKHLDDTGTIFTTRGFSGVGCILILALGIVGLFLGFPVTQAIIRKAMSNNGGFNLGGINGTGQIMEGVFSLIDKDTPMDVRTKASPVDGRQMQLVFSDEFEVEGRSFYPGDDPFWEAVDLYYWGTNDLEWYDPQQITTKGGNLVIEFREQHNHNVSYMGGMMTTWNKFCFTGGLIEASVKLPGSSAVPGFWPAVWTMGNLGRAGYGASTDGLWPYSYEACDRGAVKNQTLNGIPDAMGESLGDGKYGYRLSFLPGQRLSSCTCPGESHPGPVNPDGTFWGRSAPEIDIIEAQIDGDLAAGSVSQSCQFAPFNAYYSWDNATNLEFHMAAGDQKVNGFKGNVYQQAASVVSKTNQECYELSARPCFSTYGFQYKPGYAEDNAYVTWINDDKLSWTLHAAGYGADPIVQISARPIPKEPMYIITNLGMSPDFSGIDFDNLVFPAHMSIDYIRVYQYPDEINYGCDPPNYPTTSYINRYIEAYTNPNLTTWSNPPKNAGYGQPMPKNKLVDQC